MKRVFRVLVFFHLVVVQAQNDFSSNWKDLFSYNQIVDFTKQSNSIYAITSNAVFIYDVESDEVQKFSSVNGLSGENTSALCFHESTSTLSIGYETGLLEIIENNGQVKKVVDIVLSNVSIEKKINKIISYENQLYLATMFGVVVYDLIDYEFDDTYFIGENSTNIEVKDLAIFDGKIYAVGEDGVYIANLSDNLNDSNNWKKNIEGSYSGLCIFNNKVHVSQSNNVYEIIDDNSVVLTVSMDANVVDMSSDEDKFVVVSTTKSFVYNSSFALITSSDASAFSLTSAYIDGNELYYGSELNGVLSSSIMSPNDFLEIHPDGPYNNSLYAITVNNEDVWIVSGGYNTAYGPIGNKENVSHFNGENWTVIEYSDPEGVAGAKDLVRVTVDPVNSERVYISSWAASTGSVDVTTAGGVLVLEDDKFFDFWNAVNTNEGSDVGLSNLAFSSGYTTTRVNGSSFDSNGDFWIVNSLVFDGTGALKKKSSDGVWTSHSLIENSIDFNDLEADDVGNIWIGSRGSGMFVYNETKGQTTRFVGESMGIPNNHVLAIASRNNNIWIGTSAGVVLFSDVENVFENDVIYPAAVIIDGEDGASKLLDGIKINDIKIDGAGNVWFATATGGVLQTNSTGKETLLGFNKDNSPLPSNNILSIGINDESGEVFFGTEKGLVSYQSDIVSYGDVLSEIYAYPNPVLKNHGKVTIVGKDSNLPEGTNIKILDVAGNLVFESNALGDQSGLGGKFIWDKRNLSGVKVASGVYIVLMYNSEGQQTSSTKIAIIN